MPEDLADQRIGSAITRRQADSNTNLIYERHASTVSAKVRADAVDKLWTRRTRPRQSAPALFVAGPASVASGRQA
jgi:hypothetical protein